MDHSHYSGGHDHTKTCEEGIAPKLARATTVVTRKNANSAFSRAEQTAFKNAVVRLVNEGRYRELIKVHMDMSHNMHGQHRVDGVVRWNVVGLYRFLGWHRRYLVEFERELQRVDAILRPTASEKLGVPYWRWQDPFPVWMTGFLPARDPETGNPPPARDNAPTPHKPELADIDIIVNQVSILNTPFPGQNDYTKFTFGLEGHFVWPNGSALPAHNQVHGWVGGIMASDPAAGGLGKSPTDPIFWLHHAQVDRLWQIWRQAHPTPGPLLTGTDRIMDPWSELYDDLLDIAALGYAYDSLSL